MTKILDRIHSPADLKDLTPDQLEALASELRAFIIDVVAVKEGHLGASLGVVELTIALHHVFDTPEDTLIWDVGHQAYGHKILCGRRDNFHTLRQSGGISGFPKISESPYDAFGTGHSSTSISAALGMAIADKLNHREARQHIAVIGDASIASGMAFEGLNHAGVTQANILVILNDNAIGIDPSVGALKQYLTNVKEGIKDQDNIFEALNFDYTGPIDGHDIRALTTTLTSLKSKPGPKFLHVITTKGKGLKKAEEDQVRYHAPGKFDPRTGDVLPSDSKGMPPKFQDVFGLTLVELAQENTRIVGITPAMPTGSSLKFMMDAFPERSFDVGIAEQHAVTLSAGMALRGLTPFCNIYSTFLQRAYDQLIHDVALQNIPVVFCLDRAGLVGQDGATHHGAFDIPYLRCIPNLIVAAPRNAIALRQLMYTAQLGLDAPIAIRYPRGRCRLTNWKLPFETIPIGKGEKLKDGDKLAVLTIGPIAYNVESAIQKVSDPTAIAHFDMRFVKPLDYDLLDAVFQKYTSILTIEDGALNGGLGSAILEYANDKGYSGTIKRMGLPDRFIDHGTQGELQAALGLDTDGICNAMHALLAGT